MSLAESPRIYAALQLFASSPKVNRRYQSQSGIFSTKKPLKLSVKWAKYRTQGWCKLNTLNLEQVKASGNFIIWKPQNKNNVIRIGHGHVANELQALRNNSLIARYGDDLLVTWASVQERYRDGVERYLYEQYSPISVDRVTNARLVYVNMPGKIK
ncbi:MAG: hypothetical protein AB8C40_07245 [Gammaproteobacteria bacterium]